MEGKNIGESRYSRLLERTDTDSRRLRRLVDGAQIDLPFARRQFAAKAGASGYNLAVIGQKFQKNEKKACAANTVMYL